MVLFVKTFNENSILLFQTGLFVVLFISKDPDFPQLHQGVSNKDSTSSNFLSFVSGNVKKRKMNPNTTTAANNQ